MKVIFVLTFCIFLTNVFSQSQVFPIIKTYGGIYEVPDAIERPDPNQEYKIVVDLASGTVNPGEVNPGLINIVRMINLHSVGGVPTEKLTVIVAVHNEASYSIMDNESYLQKYKTNNPNLGVYGELHDAGVQVFICGQSLQARKIDRTKIAKDVGIATSMLTVLSTYQLKGYAWFKF